MELIHLAWWPADTMALLNAAGENSGNGVFTFQRKTTAGEAGGTPYDDVSATPRLVMRRASSSSGSVS